jgi:hypothetical protein
MSTIIQGRKGVPAVSRITWFWTLIFTFFSSGIFALGLAVYLSYWVRAKRKAGAALFIYVCLAVLLVIGLLPEHFFPTGVDWKVLSTPVSTGVALGCIAGGFLLRRELMLYYASPEGGVLEINPLWTGLFSVYYLNYCLWVVRDSV